MIYGIDDPEYTTRKHIESNVSIMYINNNYIDIFILRDMSKLIKPVQQLQLQPSVLLISAFY